MPSTTDVEATGAATPDGVTSAAPGGIGDPTPVAIPAHGLLDLARSVPIADVVWRRRAQVSGHVRSIRVRPWGDIATLEAVVADATGAVTVGWLGRRSLAGLALGGPLTVEGMVGAREGKLLILNPAYDLRPLPAS